MFAQLIASRAPQRRSPAGFAASITLHVIVVAGAVLLTSHAPVPREPRVQAVMPYLAPAVRPRPATQAPPGAVPHATGPSVINVPVTVPDIIPPVDPLRALINTDEPFVFRVGVPSHAGTFAPVVANDPATPFLDSQVEVQVIFDTRSPMPRYPQLLRDAGVEGQTLLRFVVDTLGRVESGTVQVVESTHPAFAVAVQAVLPQMRFSPARVGERKVRQLVDFPCNSACIGSQRKQRSRKNAAPLLFLCCLSVVSLLSLFRSSSISWSLLLPCFRSAGSRPS